MPCEKCSEDVWECGFEDLCQDFASTGNGWEELGKYDGPTPVMVFVKTHPQTGKCHVKFKRV